MDASAEPVPGPDPAAPAEPAPDPDPSVPAETVPDAPVEPAPNAPTEPEPVFSGPDPGTIVVGGGDGPASPVAGGPVAGTPAGIPSGAVNDPIAGAANVTASAPSPKSRSLKAFLIALLAILVIGGGSAAAYVGYILPNKPINVLKLALANSLQENQSSYKGTLGINSSSGGAAYKVDFSGATDNSAKAADVQLNLTVSGVSFPIEARIVNQNIYVKVGDLSTIASTVGAYSPTYAGLATSLSKELSNKWVVIDSTLLNQSGVNCYLDSSWSLEKADIKLLADDYNRNPFATIQSTGSDTVNGKKVEKLNLSIDNDKLVAYDNDKSLDNLSAIKSLQKCTKSTPGSSNSSTTGDHGKTPLTVWVDKSKRQIVKIAYDGNSKSDFNATFSMTMDYNKVQISTPANAEPATKVLSDIQKANPALASLLGGSLNSGTQDKAKDSKRQVDIQSLQTQIEAFFSQNGYYPSLADINNASWRQHNMSSLDVSALEDPDGSSTTLTNQPAAKVYAYQPTNSSGSSCESDDKQCAKYTLTATLSDGTTYKKNNLD